MLVMGYVCDLILVGGESPSLGDPLSTLYHGYIPSYDV